MPAARISPTIRPTSQARARRHHASHRGAAAKPAEHRADSVSLLTLGIARRRADNAERRLIALQRDGVQDWVFPCKALGGGWQAGTGDPS